MTTCARSGCTRPARIRDDGFCCEWCASRAPSFSRAGTKPVAAKINAIRHRLAGPRPYCPTCGLVRSHWAGCPEAP